MVVQPGCMATVWLLADSDGIYHGQVPEVCAKFMIFSENLIFRFGSCAMSSKVNTK